MHYHFLSYFFTRKQYGNNTLENDTDNENWYIRNETIRSKICIDNSTSNPKHWNHEWIYMQHVHNQMSDQQSNMNITTPYAHTITIYDSQLLNFAANKFLSVQPIYRLGCWRWSCLQAGIASGNWSYIRRVVLLDHVGPWYYLGLWAI
jgi:hypothetical protein